MGEGDKGYQEINLGDNISNFNNVFNFAQLLASSTSKLKEPGSSSTGPTQHS